MKRIIRVALATMLATVALAAPAAAGPPSNIVLFGDDCFVSQNQNTVVVNDSTGGEIALERSPTTCGPDDEATGPHNVVQNKRLFDSGPATESFSAFEVQLSAGSYGYYCTLHGSPAGGMRGVVRAKPRVVPIDANEQRVIWSNSQARTGNRYRVQYRREGTTKWKDWRKSTKSFNGVFGRNAKPAALAPSKRFEVRARSFRKGNPKRRSGWSPLAMVDTGP